MIIDVCTDDRNLIWIGEQAHVANQEVFGINYEVFSQRIPLLGQMENLFILAHGLKDGDEGDPVIGSEEDALYLSAVQLYRNISELFPNGYAGSVFISACEADERGRNGLSFAEEFKSKLIAQYSEAKVYYQEPPVQGPLLLPTDSGWKLA